jgi:hypothetical protein
MGTFGWVWNESNEHEAPIITFKMVTNAFDFMQEFQKDFKYIENDILMRILNTHLPI